MPTRAVGFAALVAVAALAIVGCGGDDEEEAPAPPTGAQQTVRVSEIEYALDPKNPAVSVGTVAFVVSNEGEIEHNLEVEGPEGEAEFEQDLAPGEQGTLEVDLSESGTYIWYCPVGDHRERGMEGEITVKSGQAEQGSQAGGDSGSAAGGEPSGSSGY